ARSDFLGDRQPPFLGVVEYGIHIEDDATERIEPMADHLADGVLCHADFTHGGLGTIAPRTGTRTRACTGASPPISCTRSRIAHKLPRAVAASAQLVSNRVKPRLKYHRLRQDRDPWPRRAARDR